MHTAIASRMALLGVVLLAGCASTQKLSVETDPAGAYVYLQRRGDVEVGARVAGVGARVNADSFEEDFFLLGTAPVDYEFDRKDTEGAVTTPVGGGRVTRHYREGTLRIELDGYETVQRVIRFTGDPIELVIALRRTGGR